MSIDHQGCICVGYDRDELELILDNRQLDDYEDLGFEMFSPHYDADPSDCIFGVEVLTSSQFTGKIIDIETLTDTIKTFTNEMSIDNDIVPKVYLMCHTW